MMLRSKERRQLVHQTEFGEPLCPGDEKRRREDQNRVGAFSNDGRKGAVVLCRAAHGHRLHPKPQRWTRRLDGLQAWTMRRGCKVKNDGHPRNSGNGLLEQRQALHIVLSHHQGEASDVAAWPREARYMTTAERVRVTHEYDRDRRGRSLSRSGVDGARCHDDIDLEPDKFLRKFAHPLRFALRPSVLDGDGLSLHIAEFVKSLAESFEGIHKCVWTVP